MLETARLVLRRWRTTDLDGLAALNADPRVMTWIGDGQPIGRAATAEAIDGYERLWRERGFGRFACEVRATGELAGFVGFAVPADVPELLPAVEIGWRLAHRYWGQGLATEAASAALRYGSVHCGLTRVVAIHVVGNGASERVMARLDLPPERLSTEVVYGRPVCVHAKDLAVSSGRDPAGR